MIHSGRSASHGHYFSLGRRTGSRSNAWYLFNDSHVSDASFAALAQLGATGTGDVPYMLFYERTGGS